MYTSNTDEWETPNQLFNQLNYEFNFGMDVCATKKNAKCEVFIEKDVDSLKLDWTDIEPKWKWMNPPYGREIIKWVKKASEEKMVVALLPARTDTKWFHDYIYGKAEIRFLKGRLKFGNAKWNAPFPSMIVIFN